MSPAELREREAFAREMLEELEREDVLDECGASGSFLRSGVERAAERLMARGWGRTLRPNAGGASG